MSTRTACISAAAPACGSEAYWAMICATSGNFASSSCIAPGSVALALSSPNCWA